MGIEKVTNPRTETDATAKPRQNKVMVNLGRTVVKMGLGKNGGFGTGRRRATTRVFISTAGRNTNS
jgi:hypothetical protein